MVAGRSQFSPPSVAQNHFGKGFNNFTVLQGSYTIEVILGSNETRHFFVRRHAPIRREMINESRQLVT
jgi:hypothetical protein